MNDIEADKSKNINFAIKFTLFGMVCYFFAVFYQIKKKTGATGINKEEKDLNMYLAYMTKIAVWCQIYFIQNGFVENS